MGHSDAMIEVQSLCGKQTVNCKLSLVVIKEFNNSSTLIDHFEDRLTHLVVSKGFCIGLCTPFNMIANH